MSRRAASGGLAEGHGLQLTLPGPGRILGHVNRFQELRVETTETTDQGEGAPARPGAYEEFLVQGTLAALADPRPALSQEEARTYMDEAKARRRDELTMRLNGEIKDHPGDALAE